MARRMFTSFTIELYVEEETEITDKDAFEFQELLAEKIVQSIPGILEEVDSPIPIISIEGSL